jgi:hypothetical protein
MNSKQNQIAILVKKNDVSWLELFRLNNWFDNTAVLNSNINKKKILPSEGEFFFNVLAKSVNFFRNKSITNFIFFKQS